MTHRVVALLGASNLTKALPSALPALIVRQGDDDSLAIFVGHGPGRSYGLSLEQPHGVIAWKWPGHRESGLLSSLSDHVNEHQPESVHVLMTDIGNDIPYGVPVDTLAGWVGSLTHDFRKLDARIAITSLPVESVLGLPAWQFNIIRPIMFPSHPISRAQAFDRVRRVQFLIEQTGENTGSLVLPTQASWYGLDHFHVQRKMHFQVFDAWIECLLGCASQEECDRYPWDEVVGRSRPRGARLPAITPWIRFERSFEERRLGRFRHAVQSGLRIAPQTTLYLY